MTSYRLERKSPCKQQEAIAALLTYPSFEAAAAAIGVTTNTLYRWKRDETFAAAYRQAWHGLVKESTTTLSSACGSAVQTLSDMMISAYSPACSRIYVAKIVLDYAYRGLELLELSTRLAALERREDDE